MEFAIKTISPEKEKVSCIIASITSAKNQSSNTKRLDKASDGFITDMIERGDIKGEFGETLLLQNVPNILAERVLLVGTGDNSKLNEKKFRKLFQTAISTLKKTNTKDIACFLCELPISKLNFEWKARQAVINIEDVLYEFTQLKSNNSKKDLSLEKITIHAPGKKELNDGRKGIKQGQAIANGIHTTKDLGNLPGNVCTPSYLAKQAEKLAKQFKTIKTKVLNEAEMKKLKMGSLLSVSAGSSQPAKLITMEYNGGRKGQKPVVLVGKGVTFDSGGISIKPSPAMDEMKYDMCGAASVFGTLQALAEMNAKVNVVGVVPTTENLPSGDATKPGDIVTSMSGQTIEVLNTDAEGRLILCDALTYSKRFDPAVVIDIATLTGAMVIALGSQMTGMMSNNDKLAKDLHKAGQESVDEAWRFPMNEDYDKTLESNFADIQNIGAGRAAGSITAACFLGRFTKDYDWAHLDIAGTAWNSGKNKGATGRPVPLLTQYILNRI